MDREAFIQWNRRKQMRMREENDRLIQQQLLLQTGAITTIDGVWSPGMFKGDQVPPGNWHESYTSDNPYFELSNWTPQGSNTVERDTRTGGVTVRRPAAGGGANGAALDFQDNTTTSDYLDTLCETGVDYMFGAMFDTDDDNATIVIVNNFNSYNSTPGPGYKQIRFTYAGGGNIRQRFQLVTAEKYCTISSVSLIQITKLSNYPPWG